ncbi:unnamed protein product [Aureobasidium mustum]|uniref:Cytochrome b5 heme-binding domain-containing protein n=1 Tax=Aureobasidium mustum TaxID=2773714 RepID=A0A9N8PDW7_9PEZI|nr:unnamed protein product [Aureobasidium mustum]
MGWLRLNREHAISLSASQDNSTSYDKPALHKDAISSHIEHLHADETETRLYPAVADTLPDDQLPFIPAHTVLNVSSGSSRIWIVIDNIVYDCTDFIFDHPGGSTVIKSFVGKDCSWQFWRFHTREHMKEFGRKLRIGRTEGVKNPFKEPARYVGLRRLGEVDKEWD